MTQSAAKKKYIQYLTYKAATEENLDHEAIEELKKDLKQGHCFGFSTSHAFYSVFEYDGWWRQRHAETTNWDGKPASLHKKVSLQDYLPPTHVPIEGEGQESYQDLFERNINNIVSMQLGYTRHTPEFHEKKFTQYNLLEPENKFAIFINNEPRYIHDWDRVCRHFSWSELAHFLENNKEEIAGNACLVYCHDHIVHIQYKKNRWVIYDPNYNHRSPKKMTKKFKSHWFAALEIFWILRTLSIGFDVATFDENRTVFLKRNTEITPEEVLKMLRGKGFHMIAEHTQSCLAQIIKMAEQDEKIKRVVIKKMRLRDSYNMTGLEYVIRRAPVVFARLLKLARKDQDYSRVIRDYFQNDRDDALKRIAKKAPNAIPRLLRLAANDDLLATKIVSSLLQETKDGCLFISIILRKKRLLAHFLQFADRKKDVELTIVKALEINNPSGLSGFGILLKQAPKLVAQFIKRAYSSSLIGQQLAEFISQSTRKKRTGLHQLVLYAPELMPALLKLAASNLVVRYGLTAGLVQKSYGGNSGFLFLAKYAGDSLLQLFNLAGADNTIGDAIATALVQHNRKERPGLESLMKKKPHMLPYLLNLAGSHREVYAAIRLVLQSASKKQYAQLLIALVENTFPPKKRNKRAVLLKQYRKKNSDQISMLLDEIIIANQKIEQSNKKTSLKNHSIFRPAPIHSQASLQSPTSRNCKRSN